MKKKLNLIWPHSTLHQNQQTHAHTGRKKGKERERERWMARKKASGTFFGDIQLINIARLGML